MSTSGKRKRCHFCSWGAHSRCEETRLILGLQGRGDVREFKGRNGAASSLPLHPGLPPPRPPPFWISVQAYQVGGRICQVPTKGVCLKGGGVPERRGLGVFCLARLVLVRLETQSWPWLTSLASVTPTSPCHPSVSEPQPHVLLARLLFIYLPPPQLPTPPPQRFSHHLN